MTRRISTRELCRLLGDWATPGAAAYVALATRVRLLVLDGRLPVGVGLPAERELAGALGISRTTVSAGYDVLRASGHAASRQGSGSWTTLPITGEQVPTWAPEPVPDGVLDLAHAAPAAPPQLHAAYADALDALPRYLPGVGYDYRGLRELRDLLAARFTERGLPTAAEQVVITSGALQAVRLGLSLAVRAGSRVLVEQPGYPNGLDVLTDLGARPVPVPVTGDGWDLAACAAALQQTRPAAAYLVPDFQNPSGALMGAADRATLARLLDAAGTVAVIDETLAELDLDGGPTPMPAPFAAFGGRTTVVTVGSASKIAWGGLRVGWLRTDPATATRLAALRSRQDLSSPIVEQLAFVALMHRLPQMRAHRLAELTEGRTALTALVRDRLPGWSSTVPRGGQVLWCRLPEPRATALCEAAAAHGVRLTPGARFASDGTLESWVRLPFTHPEPQLRRGIELLAHAWTAVSAAAPGRRAATAAPAGRDLDLDLDQTFLV